ncbi:hypothetical protein [Geodermatophilus sp. CPCC 205506]|uniref:hypothetical protein n=1 Tax=Geodermatophilus sp. CPCC 205506 TaxID=2936596 RepID=UPI003EEAB5EF
MSKNLNSNELTNAMLCAHLSGNEIKVLLAYVSKGGWKHGTEVFLPESVRKEYGLADSTVKRMRKNLVAKGWMVPTGNKSHFGCDMYLLRIPTGVHPEPSAPVSLDPPVVHSDPLGSPDRSTEVTKELTQELSKSSNEEEDQESNPPEDDSGLIGNDPSSPRFSGLILNSGSSELPAGRPADERAVELKRQCRTYRPDLTEGELDRMVSGMLNRERLREVQDEARRRRQETQEAAEKELTW